MLKKIKKIIISTIFWVPMLGQAENFHQNFAHMTFEKDVFQCTTCTEQNCAEDVVTAGHCVSWCHSEAYEACWKGASEAMNDSESSFSKTYRKLTPTSKKQLTHLLSAAKGRKILNAFEEHANTAELLNELQTLHREQQKQRSSAVAGIMQLVP